MIYLVKRSLYYYFLMREVTDAESEAWCFIAKVFGVKPKDMKAYQKVLENQTLNDLSTIDDIDMHKNYINGFCTQTTEFGKALCEQEVIEAKALALYKIRELFGDKSVKGNRLRSLSHNYKRDHVASVLYALHLLYFNYNTACNELARNILVKELKDGKNSDAGLILLTLDKNGEREIASCLKCLPDMLLLPQMLKYLNHKYEGDGGSILQDNRTIGFGGNGI